MLSSSRFALLVVTAISASSVAPAQVGQQAEPLLPLVSASLPKIVSPAELLIDELAPLDGPESSAVQPAIPEPTRPSGDLSSTVAQLRSADPGSRERECLAVGIYFESKSEPLSGQLAVGEVIANRANSRGRFPSSYCGVLFQRGQFSFVRGGRLPTVARGSKQWQTAVAVARVVDQELHSSAAPKALFFHARRVAPGWKLKRVAAIGNHVFYR
jgi:spore germination cell wall hydrolase CwlJ-like protein